ncbi:hypothetical protein CPC08DRAFT_448970 [Agrocybe pediades]|nr:hypothetical protein CPC08DRAFT_448970 [Agrocybe pediades]
MHIASPLCSKCTVTATNALWLGEVQASVAKWSRDSKFCCMCAMRLRDFAKTIRTSRETVAGEGIWYSGLPVFIKLWKPRSLTIVMDV